METWARRRTLLATWSGSAMVERVLRTTGGRRAGEEGVQTSRSGGSGETAFGGAGTTVGQDAEEMCKRTSSARGQHRPSAGALHSNEQIGWQPRGVGRVTKAD